MKEFHIYVANQISAYVEADTLDEALGYVEKYLADPAGEATNPRLLRWNTLS